MSEEQIKNTTNGVQEQDTLVSEGETLIVEGDTSTPTDAPAADTDVGQGPNIVDELQAQIAKLEKEVAVNRDNWLRAAADYKNFKRRVDQERADLIRSASVGLLLKMLPALDDMERATGTTPPEIAATPWYEGIKLIAQKLQTIVESEGVTQIAALGQDFDPNQHEAVIYEPAGSGQEGKVVAELQKGYKLRDRVLRPTMVKVGKEE
jgi:molecular chaperone GrpE